MNLATDPIIKASLYRKVTLQEIENDHTFRSVRYFPELRNSKSEITKRQVGLGRDFQEHVAKIEHFRRKKQHKFTHHLEQLTKSSLDQINALSQFRKVISDERMQLRTANLPEAPSRPISPLRLTEEENLASANAKLTKFAISYDSGSFINILAGFQGSNDAGTTLFLFSNMMCLTFC
jgi:septation ring formation regulator EzrA